jgi:hypothetical protein
MVWFCCVKPLGAKALHELEWWAAKLHHANVLVAGVPLASRTVFPTCDDPSVLTPYSDESREIDAIDESSYLPTPPHVVLGPQRHIEDDERMFVGQCIYQSTDALSCCIERSGSGSGCCNLLHLPPFCPGKTVGNATVLDLLPPRDCPTRRAITVIVYNARGYSAHILGTL